MKLTKGQKINYTMTMSMAAMKPTPTTMGMLVTDVKGDIYTVKYSIGSIMGQKPVDVTVKMNSSGKIVGGSAGGQMIQGRGSAQLPTKPVKIGETWTQTVDQASGVGKMKVTSTYTFKGLKTVNGRQVADIGIKVKSSGAGGVTVSGTGSMLLAAADCSMVSTSIDTSTSVGGQGTPIDMKVVIARK
jgi:hypothetical protein